MQKTIPAKTAAKKACKKIPCLNPSNEAGDATFLTCDLTDSEMDGTSGFTNATLFQNQNKLISSNYVLAKLTTKKSLVIYASKIISTKHSEAQ